MCVWGGLDLVTSGESKHGCKCTRSSGMKHPGKSVSSYWSGRRRKSLFLSCRIYVPCQRGVIVWSKSLIILSKGLEIDHAYAVVL